MSLNVLSWALVTKLQPSRGRLVTPCLSTCFHGHAIPANTRSASSTGHTMSLNVLSWAHARIRQIVPQGAMSRHVSQRAFMGTRARLARAPMDPWVTPCLSTCFHGHGHRRRPAAPVPRRHTMSLNVLSWAPAGDVPDMASTAGHTMSLNVLSWARAFGKHFQPSHFRHTMSLNVLSWAPR